MNEDDESKTRQGQNELEYLLPKCLNKQLPIQERETFIKFQITHLG